MKLIIILCLFILIAGCTPLTCNEPYIIKGKECCLDQNSNAICDSDEVNLLILSNTSRVNSTENQTAKIEVETVKDAEPTIYTKDISQMALLSKELEAGYVLKRDDSGKIFTYKESLFDDLKLNGLLAAFKWSYEKQADEADEDRSMTIYMFKFNTESEADRALQELQTKMQDSDWYVKTNDYYKKEAVIANEYSFNKFNWHVLDFKEKNIVTRLYFQTASEYDPKDEIYLYQKRIIDAIKRTEIITPDILPTKIAASTTKSNDSITMEFKSFEKKLNVKPSDEYDYLGSLPSFINDKEKIHLYLELEIKNNNVEDIFKNNRGMTAGKGFSPDYASFQLTDQDGNIYHATYYSTYIEGYRDSIIEKRNSLRQKIVFPILRSANEFSLKAYDEKGNQVGSLKFEI